MHDEDLLLPGDKKLAIARELLDQDRLLIHTDSAASLSFALPVLEGEFGLFAMMSLGCAGQRTWVASANLAIRGISLRRSYQRMTVNTQHGTKPSARQPIPQQANKPLFTEDGVRWNKGVYAMSSKGVRWQAGLGIGEGSGRAKKLIEELEQRNLQSVTLERRIVPSEAFDGTMRSAIENLRSDYKEAIKALTAVRLMRAFRIRR